MKPERVMLWLSAYAWALQFGVWIFYAWTGCLDVWGDEGYFVGFFQGAYPDEIRPYILFGFPGVLVFLLASDVVEKVYRRYRPKKEEKIIVLSDSVSV